MSAIGRIPNMVSSSLRVLTGALCVTALLAGADRDAPVRAEEPVRGGFLTMALQSPAPILVSAFNTGGFIGVVSTKMMEGLISYGFDLEPQPELAEFLGG